MRAPALQALGPRRGRVAVPLALAGVVLVGWAAAFPPTCPEPYVSRLPVGSNSSMSG